MSDDGEKTCPLCAEEMDLTDQQLKPCNCGYEICVWCWHHLMEMAEKDGTEGRCPACRTPYDKEKIVGTAGKCERVVAEHTIERKRSQKSKSKLSEGRKQLSSVRVIRRNLVYIVGLPLHLADEDLLQCREYFGQYGKVLKVSMSRTAAGVIQQFPNNTCSVYITYAKEEEAIRCIQSVNGFTLEGRPLRACFGTTKYCHAWLRNMPCSNPDCLYLHEVGSQEDSFTKDEVVSAYTRNRVQQITGAAINQQRCSGNVLPPPLDDYNSLTSTAKPIVKSMSNNLASARGSSPNGSSGRPIGLPPGASWAALASISQPPASTTACSNGPMKQTKASGAVALSAVVASTGQDPRSRNDASDETISNDKINSMYSSGKTDMSNSKQYVHSSPSMSSNEKPSALDGDPATAAINDQLLSPSSTESDQEISLPSNASNSVDLSAKSSASGSDYGSDHADGDVQYLCSDYSSMSMRNEYSGVVRDHSSLSEEALNVSEHQLQQSSDFECSRELPTLPVTKEASLPMSGLISVNQWDTGDSSQSEMLHKCPEVEEDVVEFNNQRLKDPEVVCPSSHLPNSSNILGQSNHSGSQPFQQYEGLGSFDFNEDPVFVNGTVADGSAMPFLGSIISNAPENTVLSSYCPASDRQPVSEHIELEKLIGMHQGNATSSNSNLPLDGENSIISNILSLDLDSLDDSLTSPQNLAQLLGETDGDSGPLSRILSSRKVQDNNLSRFSFARQEESKNQTLDADPLFSSFGQLSTGTTYNSNSFGYRDLFTEKSGVADGFSYNSLNESNNFSSIAVSSNNFPGPRAPISAPPGFSVPNRAPPPGFTSHERVEQAYDTAYGNQVRDASSMMRNSSLMPSGGIGNTNDLEFHDPAILKVVERGVQSGLNNSGIDMGSSYHQQCNNAFENEAKLQLLMQRSLSQHQNQRYSDINASYSLVNDPYGIPSRFLNQSQVNLSNPYGIPSRFVDQIQVNNMSPYGQPQLQQSNNSLMANGPWNEVQGGGPLSIADLLRHERLGYNKFYPSYEETKLCMPSSGDLYNRTFGL